MWRTLSQTSPTEEQHVGDYIQSIVAEQTGQSACIIINNKQWLIKEMWDYLEDYLETIADWTSALSKWNVTNRLHQEALYDLKCCQHYHKIYCTDCWIGPAAEEGLYFPHLLKVTLFPITFVSYVYSNWSQQYFMTKPRLCGNTHWNYFSGQRPLASQQCIIVVLQQCVSFPAAGVFLLSICYWDQQLLSLPLTLLHLCLMFIYPSVSFRSDGKCNECYLFAVTKA